MVAKKQYQNGIIHLLDTKGCLNRFNEINHEDYPVETIAVLKEVGINKMELKRVHEASMAAYYSATLVMDKREYATTFTH